MLLSRLPCTYKCGGCKDTYYGKTKRYFKVYICKHLKVSHLTTKKAKIDNSQLTAIQEHLLCSNYLPFVDGFSILTKERNYFKLEMMESLLIVRHEPVLKEANSSLPLELF